MRRKLFSKVICFLAGIFAGDVACETNLFFAIFFSCIILFFAVKGFKLNKHDISMAILGVIWIMLFTFSYEAGEINSFVGKDVTVEALISETAKSRSGNNEYTCRVSSVNMDSRKYKLGGERVLFSDTENAVPFDRALGGKIIFSCVFKKPHHAANPRMFDYRRYLYSKGIVLKCESAVVKSFSESENIYHKTKNLIIRKREHFLESLPDEELKAVVESVIFGNSKALPEDIYQSFQMNGTAHVLAVSGLHIGVLYGCYAFFRKRTGMRILTPIFVLFLLIYGTCAMWAVSVKRATIIIIMKMIAECTDRPFDLITGTAVAAFLICIKNPFALFSTGFQLSFLAVCILAFVPRAIERIMQKAAWGAFIIQIGLAPYICYAFNYFSFSGFIANIPVIFFMSLFVPIGIVTFLIYAFTEISLPGAARLLSGLGNMMVHINEVFSFDGKGAMDTTTSNLWCICLFYLSVFFFSSENFTIDYLRKNWKNAASKYVAVLFCVIATWISSTDLLYNYDFKKAAPSGAFDQATFVFTDMTVGECTHVRFGNDIDMLIDGGGRNNYNSGKRAIKPYLLKNGVRDIDVAIPSLTDKRHYLGLFQLSKCFDVEKIMLWAQLGDRIDVSPRCRIEVLWPENADRSDFYSADNRRVIKVYAEGVSCIVYGGLDHKNEEKFINKYLETEKLLCDIVKISTPEYGKVSYEKFLEEAKPKIAVMSCDETKKKLCDETIEKIREKDIMLYRTDQLGAVGIVIEKEKIKICTQQKNMRLKYFQKN